MKAEKKIKKKIKKKKLPRKIGLAFDQSRFSFIFSNNCAINLKTNKVTDMIGLHQMYEGVCDHLYFVYPRLEVPSAGLTEFL